MYSVRHVYLNDFLIFKARKSFQYVWRTMYVHDIENALYVCMIICVLGIKLMRDERSANWKRIVTLPFSITLLNLYQGLRNWMGRVGVCQPKFLRKISKVTNNT